MGLSLTHHDTRLSKQFSDDVYGKRLHFVQNIASFANDQCFTEVSDSASCPWTLRLIPYPQEGCRGNCVFDEDRVKKCRLDDRDSCTVSLSDTWVPQSKQADI